jgi:hypothetical protein
LEKPDITRHPSHGRQAVTYTIPALLAELQVLAVVLQPEGDAIAVTGPVTPLLRDEIRRQKPGLLLHLQRQRAWELVRFIDGSAPYAERIAKMPEYEDLTVRIAAYEGSGT